MLPFQKLSSSVLGVPPPISCTISVKDIVAVGLFSKNTLKKIVSVVFIKLSFTVHYSHQWREFYPKNCH